MKSNTLAIGLAVLIGGTGLAYFALSGTNASDGVHQALSFLHVPGAGSSAAAGAAGTTSSPNTFADASLGFSFPVPDGYHVGKTLSDSGETILVQDKSALHGFQIVVSPFTDSGTSITPSRVEREAGLKVANSAQINVANAARGLAFDDLSSSPPLRDFWFVHNGYLYQAQTWKSDAKTLESVLTAWHWK